MISIYSHLRDIKRGISNLWKWRKIIYRDRDWDWAYMYELLEYKMRCMAKYHEDYGQVVSSPHIASDLRRAADLLHRIRREDYPWSSNTYEDIEAQMKEDETELWELVRLRSRTWWD